MASNMKTKKCKQCEDVKPHTAIFYDDDGKCIKCGKQLVPKGNVKILTPNKNSGGWLKHVTMKYTEINGDGYVLLSDVQDLLNQVVEDAKVEAYIKTIQKVKELAKLQGLELNFNYENMKDISKLSPKPNGKGGD